MTTKEELVEQRLIEACDRAIAEGWAIKPYKFVNEEEKICCAIGAIGRFADSVTPWTDCAAKELGLSHDEIWQIINGFDGNTVAKDDHFYAVGERLGKKYLKGESK